MTTGVSRVKANPYDGTYSSYAEWRNDKLIRAGRPEQKLAPLAAAVHERLRAHIADADFPCIGAKAALAGDFYRFGFYPKMNSPQTNGGLAHDLWEYAREQARFGTNYATFVACFAEPEAVDEQTWENTLWAQLQNLHELDCAHYDWDKSVSRNPKDADFSFSFAETGFFIVGLHPNSSRLARRFPWATMVFNVHAQFERLREQNQFERMQQAIRARDLKLQGSLNPNLSDFGKQSEAKQYSGRAVEENWKCPFHAFMPDAKNAGK